MEDEKAATEKSKQLEREKQGDQNKAEATFKSDIRSTQ